VCGDIITDIIRDIGLEDMVLESRISRPSGIVACVLGHHHTETEDGTFMRKSQ